MSVSFVALLWPWIGLWIVLAAMNDGDYIDFDVPNKLIFFFSVLLWPAVVIYLLIDRFSPRSDRDE